MVRPVAILDREHVRSATRLTVVVVSYNCRPMLRDCLASLRRQTIAAELRVVVVDNDSTDGTHEMMAAEFPWVTFIPNRDNVGFGRASNAGLRFAPSGDVLMLNPDTVLPDDGLARAMEALHDRPGVGILGVRLVQPNGEVDHASRRQIPTPATSLAYMLKIGRLFRRGSKDAGAYTDPEAFDSEGVTGAVNGAFMLIREDVVRQVGGFDEDFWMYGEDLDLCLRTTQAGWDVYYWPGVEVVHVKGGSSGKARALRVNFAFHQAMWIFYKKHYLHRYGRLRRARDRRRYRGEIRAVSRAQCRCPIPRPRLSEEIPGNQ